MTGNQATTETQKNVNADMQAWVKANPTATPQEVAQHQSDLAEQSVGGLSMIGKELREDRKNYMAAHPGATAAQMIADRPDLADETSYVAIKGEQAKTQAAAGVDKLTAKNSFSSVNPQWDQLETNINWLAAQNTAKRSWPRWRGPNSRDHGTERPIRQLAWVHGQGRSRRQASSRPGAQRRLHHGIQEH